jgi:hypothetical protein
MRKKALVVALLCVMAIAAISIGTAGAAAVPPWYNCTVQFCGSHVSFYFIQVTDTAATPAWAGSRFFIMDPNAPLSKSQLASALTGYASGGTVACLIPDITEFAAVQAVGAGVK